MIGREFRGQLLGELAGSEEETESSIRELKATELILEKRLFPEATYLFGHALTQEVAYSSLLQRHRKELHRGAGEVIERLWVGRLTEQYGVLAHHFSRGEAWGKAFEYLCKAADKAARDFATGEAIALYGQALEVAGRLGEAVDRTAVMDVHAARSGLSHVGSDFAGARAEAEQMLTLAREAGDRVREGRALALIAWACTWARDLDEAIVAAQEAIEVARDLDDEAILGRARYIIGFVRAVIGEHDAATAEIEKALVLCRKARDPVHESLALATAGLLKNWESDYPAAEHFQRQGLAIAREHNLLAPLLFNSFVCGITLGGAGRYDEAMALLRETLALTVKVGDEAIHYRVLNCMGWLHAEVGDLDGAIELNRKSSEVGFRIKDPGSFPNAELNLGENFLAQGDLVLARESFERIHRHAQADDTSRWMRYRYSIRLYAGLAELSLRTGSSDLARDFLKQSMDLATPYGARKNMVRGWRLKGEIALADKEWEEAGKWLAQASALAKEIGNPPQMWKSSLALGEFYEATGEEEKAEEARRSAADLIESTRQGIKDPALREAVTEP